MNLLFYLLCAGILLYLAVYYSSAVLVFLLLCVLLLPAGLGVLAGFSAARSRGQLWTTTPIWSPEDEIPLRVSLQPRRLGCRLPLPHLKYRVDIACSLENTRARVLLDTTGENCVLPWAPGGCGVYRFAIRRGWGRDYLKLFPFPAPCEKQALELTVLPKIYPCSIRLTSGTTLFAPDGQVYQNGKKGDDLTELSALRPYVPGDKLNRIHWKLSLKQDALLVKEGSAPAGCAVVLFADMRYLGQGFLDGLFSLSLSLIEGEHPHYLCWYGGEHLRRELILGHEDLYALCQPLLTAKRCSEHVQPEALYAQSFPGECWALGLRIADGLYMGDKQILSAAEFPEKLTGLLLEL